MIDFGEFAPDIADLNTSVCRVANNVLPGINSYLPLKSLSESSDALINPCQGAIAIKDSADVNYIYAGDNTKLYNITGATVTDYSKVGDYTDNAETWDFAKWGEQVIASKYGDTPQIMTLGGTVFADLGGTPPQGRTMAVIKGFIVLGNTWDATDGAVTNRVRWSGFEEIDEWTPGTNQADFQNLQGNGGAVKRVIGGEYGVVFQQNSIWRMSYVGTPFVFQFDEVEPVLGTPAGGSVVQYGTNIYYLSHDGFYVLRNGQSSEPIGVSKVDNYFWNDVDESNLHRIKGTISADYDVIMWSYPSTASNGEPDKIIIYNYKTGRWSTAETNTQILFGAATSGVTLEDLDAFGTLETIGSSLDSAAWKGGSSRIGAFSTNNKLSFFSGATLSGNLETAEIGTETNYSTLVSVRPVVDGAATVTIETRDSLADTPVAGLETSLDSSGKANFRTHARYHRIKINTAGDFTHAQGVEPNVVARGKR